jgi:hypothetical protein
MAISAVLAIIANGGQVIIVIYTEGEEIHYFLFYIIDNSDKTLQRRPRPTPCEEAPGVGYVPPSKPWRWRGKRLRHCGDVCVLVFS